jgi:flagellar motor switch protein FliN/FliY
MSEPIATDSQTKQDDWDAAMAEQQATENHTTTATMDDDNESAISTPTHTSDEELAHTSDEELAHTSDEELTKPSPVFEKFSKNDVLNDTYNDIDMILDIPVQLTVELGRTRIAIKSLLQLAQGSVIELDGMAGEPMDILVNGCLIAQGEVVVVNEKFGIRLTDIITPSERIRKLNR